MNEPEQTQTDQQQHWEDPDFPGWCGVCGRPHPCPGTATPEEQRRIIARYVGRL